MPTATMTSKGQITVPAETRRKLRLVAGTRIDFVENAAGETVLRAKTGDIRELRGIFAGRGPSLTIEEMDEAVKRGVVARYRRSFE